MTVFTSTLEQIREQLEGKKAEIYEEIANYPPPIPACDQQFNYLLEERTRVSQELKRLNTITEQLNNGSEKELHAFIADSAYLNDLKF